MDGKRLRKLTIHELTLHGVVPRLKVSTVFTSGLDDRLNAHILSPGLVHRLNSPLGQFFEVPAPWLFQ